VRPGRALIVLASLILVEPATVNVLVVSFASVAISIAPDRIICASMVTILVVFLLLLVCSISLVLLFLLLILLFLLLLFLSWLRRWRRLL